MHIHTIASCQMPCRYIAVCLLYNVSSKNASQKHTCILTMSFMRDALVGMACSPRRLAKRRDLSRALSSNSRCFSVSLSDTGIGMASVASITRDAILIKKGRKQKKWAVKEHKLIRRRTCTSKHNAYMQYAASYLRWLRFSSTCVGSLDSDVKVSHQL